MISVRAFRRAYGIEFRTVKTGFATYTAIVRSRGNELRVPNLCYPFGPRLQDALRQLVKSARGADALGESFELFMARQHGILRVDARKRWDPQVRALRLLRSVFGPDATEDLLWRVRLDP